MSDNPKVKCEECGWHGTMVETLRADNPFEPEDEIHGCPDCKSIDCFRVCCEAIGCLSSATCGTPTKHGYRQTCGKHIPDKEELR